jgi:hypothetical protein
MRSMLALGASNLALTTSSSADLANRAIAHRVEAVKLLNKALSRPATSREEADARFAAFMSKLEPVYSRRFRLLKALPCLRSYKYDSIEQSDSKA